MVNNKKAFSIRMAPDVREELARVASLGRVSPAEVIRICVIEGLPIIREAFTLIRDRFKERSGQSSPPAAPRVNPVRPKPQPAPRQAPAGSKKKPRPH